MITSREENLAKRLIERYSLTPRILIEDVAAIYADVSSLAFPVSVDGVSLHLKSPVRRAEIIINSNQPHKRWRFTLAHELGHVLIPGHTGSIVDDIDLSHREKSRYLKKESEANRFAAELLMPTEWAIEFIGKPKDMAKQVNSLAEEADVSVEAATLKAIKVGPSGYVVAKSVSKKIVWATKTNGTRSNCPMVGDTARADTVLPRKNYSICHASDSVFHWWKEETSVEVPDLPEESWREILTEIVQSLPLTKPDKAKQSVNGIISVANGFTRQNRSRESIYAACLHNVRNRANDSSDVSLILAHPRFTEFLTARVYDFIV